MNIFKKIFRFFFPKGGWNKNFNAGLQQGQKIGKQRAKRIVKK